MKLTTGHVLSLALNAILVAVVVTLWRDRQSATDPVGRVNAPPTGGTVAAGQKPTTASLPEVMIGGDWRHWIEPLRAANVPTRVLADLVRADFDRRWKTRQAELQQKYMRGEADADALAALALEHDATLETELRAALGPEEYRHWDMERILEGMRIKDAQLSDAEQNTVYDLERGLRDELRNAESDKLRGTIDQATLNQRQQSAQDTVAGKLKALLGDARAAALQGADDDTLGRLRRGLRDVPLTDDQLQALAEVQRKWDDTRDQLVTLQTNTQDPAYAAAIVRNDENWRNDFERIAGPPALEQFLRSSDSRYAELRQHATAWQLSAPQIDDVFTTIANYEAAVRDYSHDAEQRDVAPLTIRTTIAQFEQQTERALQQKLGPAKYEELKRNGIAPAAPSTSTVP